MCIFKRLSTNNLNLFTLNTWLVILLIVFSMPSSAQSRIDVLQLPDISQWEAEIFSGETHYEVIKQGGKPLLKANSQSSASGLVRKIDIDLSKTPYMNWSWKVDNILQDVDETRKSGDDYAARIYVVISGGLLFWRTRAISYVWSNSLPVEHHWPNAFTENALMIAVQSGDQKVGQWVTEKRNILKDIQDLLGLDKTEINAVAIMTDTDNSKQSASAYYGDVFFTSH